MIDWDDHQLYSHEPRLRWERAKDTTSECKDSIESELQRRFRDWPPFWRGSANAWLVYLGPSPGNSGTGYLAQQIPSLGIPQPHFRNFRDSAGFWDRIRDWTVQGFSSAGVFNRDPDAAYGVSMMGNLTSQNIGNSRTILDEQLVDAMVVVMKALELVKPRLIMTLETRVSKLLVSSLASGTSDLIDGPNVIAVPAKNQRFDFYKPKNWEFRSPWGRLMVAESPQHPSKHNFYDSKVVDYYLCKLIKHCLLHS